MAQKIQFRRDTVANWASVNPILSQGELGYEINTGKFKIGNGVAYWNELPYFEGGASAFSGLSGTIGETQIPTGQNAVIIPSHIRAANNAETGQVLGINGSGQFQWTTVSGAGGLALVATTGNYGDLNQRPTFATGNLREFSPAPISPGSLVETYQYEIVNPGSSNWTLAGAANSNTGTVFTALNNGAVAGGNGTVKRVGQFAVALTGNYKDLLDVPTLVSQFQNDVGYVSTVTLASYVTTSQVDQIVGQQIDAAIATSGTFYQVLQELSAASTSTSVTDALANRLRVDVNTQNLTTEQKANAVTNLGLATVAVSGSYNDLVDKPQTFQISPATGSSLGGVIIGAGLTFDQTGRISINTSTVKVELIPPTTLKGQLNQEAGQIRGDVNYLYFAKSDFNPSPYTTNAAATTSTNIVTSAASQWLATIDNSKAGYSSGTWRLYNNAKNTSYAITNIATAAGVAYVTIDTAITYGISETFYLQQADTWSRVAQMDDYGTQSASIGGLNAATVGGDPITLPAGQPYGTTATMFVLDCTGVTFGELAVSFTDSTNTEYYKGTLEVHLYPDNTYIIQPNTAGNKTDRIGIGFTSGANAPYTNPALIKIPVFNTDFNQATNLTNTTCSITNIKYSWLIRSNI